MKKGLIIFLISIFCLSALPAFAEDASTFSQSGIVFTPGSFGPGEKISASIDTYSFDIVRSNIVWKIDDKVVAGGKGVSRVSFDSPDFGKSKTVSAGILTFDNQAISLSAVAVSHDIDFLWEALTYTPVWYKGKAVPTNESEIRVTAVPYLYKNGKILPESDLIYEWYLNFKKIGAQSGAYKNFFTFKTKVNDDDKVSLKVSTRDSTVSFEKTIVLSASSLSPKILFYQESPLDGLYANRALSGQVKSPASEFILRAEPFFFSVKRLNDLDYSWTVGGNKILTGTQKPIFPMRLKDEEQKGGIFSIGLNISNYTELLQSASGGLNLNI